MICSLYGMGLFMIDFFIELIDFLSLFSSYKIDNSQRKTKSLVNFILIILKCKCKTQTYILPWMIKLNYNYCSNDR